MKSETILESRIKMSLNSNSNDKVESIIKRACIFKLHVFLDVLVLLFVESINKNLKCKKYQQLELEKNTKK